MTADEAHKFLPIRTSRMDLNKKETEAVETLAKDLDYLPLALEQAATYITIRKCPIKDYLAKYQRGGLEFFDESEHGVFENSKSVATTCSLNFNQVEKVSKLAAEVLRLSAFLQSEQIPEQFIVLSGPDFGVELLINVENYDSNPLLLDDLLNPLTQYSLIQQNIETKTFSIQTRLSDCSRFNGKENGKTMG